MFKSFRSKIIPKHYQVAAAGWLSRLISSFCQIALISIALSYLGVNLYAVFAIILSLQCWFALTDCGIGSSLQNYISEARAKNEDLQPLLSNATIIILLLFLLGIVIFSIITPFLQYFLLRRIAPELATSQYYILWITGIILLATNIFGVGYRVFFGMQKGYLVYFYQGASYLIAIITILLTKYLATTQYRLLIILVAWLFPPLIFALLSFVQSFPLRNIKRHFNLKIIRAIVARGWRFCLIATTATFAVLSDYLVISQTLDTQNIAIYNILGKSFNLIFFIYLAVLSGLWPEMSELFVKKEWHQANNLLKINILLGFAIVIICTLIFLFAKNLVITTLAAKTQLTIATIPILLFGVYYLLRVWVDSFAMALQSQNYLKILWRTSIIQAMLSIGGMYILSKHLGISGIIIGLLLALFLTSSWILPLAYHQRKKYYEL